MAYISAEDVAIIREELKEAFPQKDGWKFSVRREHASSVRVAILRAPAPFRDAFGKPVRENVHVNQHWYKEHWSEHSADLFGRMLEIIKKKWWDKSDAQMDYFCTAFYFSLDVGKWDKPCEYVAECWP